MDWKYTDLGCKLGGSLNEARKKGPGHGFPRAEPRECLGVDRQESYRRKVERAGYAFCCADLPRFDWPAAEVYLAWNFLEHLRDLDEAKAVLGKMLDHSRQGVWLLLPSFEEGDRRQLRDAGFDFPWAAWSHHQAQLQRKHVVEVASKHSRLCRIVAKGAWPFRSSRGLLRITETAGPRRFEPTVYGAWEVRLYLTGRQSP